VPLIDLTILLYLGACAVLPKEMGSGRLLPTIACVASVCWLWFRLSAPIPSPHPLIHLHFDAPTPRLQYEVPAIPDPQRKEVA
jgi:hypothetical protein